MKGLAGWEEIPQAGGKDTLTAEAEKWYNHTCVWDRALW